MKPAAARPLSPPPAPPRPGARLPAWTTLRAHWPALLVTAGFLALLGAVVQEVKSSEHGHFVYTLDDSYFHMAVARNLLRHGVWGVSALDGFSSGTSSLLWPLVITACFALFGVHEYFPLVLNVLADVGLLFYLGWLIRRTTGSGFLSLLALAAAVLLTPLLAVASTGMEHSLQALLGLIFVDLAARLLTDDAQRLAAPSLPGWLCAAGALLVMTRYEGLFLVAPVGLLLLCRGRWRLAVRLGLIAAAPIVLFGAVAVLHGWYFLPNSLLLKGNTQVQPTLAALWEYGGRWYAAMLGEPHMFGLMAALAAALLASLHRRGTLWSYPAVFLTITLLAAVQHLQFAGLGWFYRYEAYLIVLALAGVGSALGGAGPGGGWRSAYGAARAGALGMCALVLGGPLLTRGVKSIGHVATASYNIYEQQYQMGHFVRRFYNGRGVAANDVGAVTFFGDIRLLDTFGLTDVDVLRARRAGAYDQATLRCLLRRRGVEAVMVYDIWSNMYGGPLPEWVLVGQWRIPHNTICGSDLVSFYAPGPECVEPLTRHLREFAPSLPPDIIQDGIYRGAAPMQVSGTYGPEGPADSLAYWTGGTAEFTVYPGPEDVLGSENTRLHLAVLPVSKGQTLEVFFNDQLVETRTLAADASAGWVSIPVKARWREGVNTVRLAGRGTPVYPPGDARPFLYRVLDPRRMVDEHGVIVPQRDRPAPGHG